MTFENASASPDLRNKRPIAVGSGRRWVGLAVPSAAACNLAIRIERLPL
jgi:hypothetical protein